MLRFLMVLVLIEKGWLETLGDMAAFIASRDESEKCVSVLCGRVKAGYPFVEAEIVNTDKREKSFIPAQIPSGVVMGIFDLTDAEVEAYGFHPGKKKQQSI